MAVLAAFRDLPIDFPFSSVIRMPSRSSLYDIKHDIRIHGYGSEDFTNRDRIIGMLMQLAAATAQKGTNRPIRGGANLVRELRPRAVTSAPPVAQT